MKCNTHNKALSRSKFGAMPKERKDKTSKGWGE